MTHRLFAALATFLVVATPVLADGIAVADAYARASTPGATSGAAFMVIENRSDLDDRLLSVRSDIAARVELHTHAEDADGVMRMGAIEGGIALPAGGTHALARGGDHVMLMGLTDPLEQGSEVEIVLTFERAGDVAVAVTVDHDRKPEHGAGSGHSGHSGHGG